MTTLNLIEYGEEVRINLAYVHHTPKNPLFESKIKRGFHGRFGNKFQIPDYRHKNLILGKSSGGTNDSRWATTTPHPLHLPVLPNVKTEVFGGKHGAPVPHAVSRDWVDGFADSRRGHLTVRRNPQTKQYVLSDHSDSPHHTVVSTHATEDAAKAAGDTHLAKGGAHSLPPYTPPHDVDLQEPPPKGVTAAGLLIREPDGRIWIREPSNHYAGYEHSFPKGTAEPHETLQQVAHREAYEETGLKAKIVGFLGDFQANDAGSVTRMYIADRTGGEPTTNDETWSLKLLPPDEAHALLNRERDKNIISEYSPHPDEKWLLKAYNGNEDRVATEVLSNAIYHIMGVDVPKAGLTEQNGKVALTYPARQGKIQNIPGPNKDFGKGFMVDAFVANRDVAGLLGNPKFDNVLWHEGKPIRIDQGGTLGYRGMGGQKDFTHTPSEVWSMFESYGQAKSTMDVTPLQKRQQATEIYRIMTPQLIDDLVDQAPFADLKMKEHVREVLQARARWMGQFGKGMIDEKDEARTPTFEEVLQDGVEKVFNLDEMRGLKDKVRHTEHDADSLFTHAEIVQQSFKFLMDMGVGFSHETDAMVHDSDPDYISKVAANLDAYHVIIAPIKKRDVSEEKVDGKYGGDWSQLTDIVRGTIAVPHPANIPGAMKTIKKLADERGWHISQLDSKLYVDPRRPNDTGPTSAGYRDISVRIETQDGFQIELQFNWNDMIVAKEQNHGLYEKARKIARDAGMKPNAEQQAEIDVLDAQMKENYGKVWDKVSGEPSGGLPPPEQTAEYKKLMAEKKAADDAHKAEVQSKYNVGGKLFGVTDYTTDYTPNPTKSYDAQLQDYVNSQKAKKKLKDDPTMYFNMDASTPLIDIGQLESTKSDEENKSGAANALKFMAQAAAGKMGKRDPISVTMGQNGKYKVLDGNASFTTAKSQGFKRIPVNILNAEEAEKLKTEIAAKEKAKAKKKETP